MMQPPQLAYDPVMLIEAKHKPKEQTTPKRLNPENQQQVVKEVRDYIGGCSAHSGGTNQLEHDRRVTRARLVTARFVIFYFVFPLFLFVQYYFPYDDIFCSLQNIIM